MRSNINPAKEGDSAGTVRFSKELHEADKIRQTAKRSTIGVHNGVEEIPAHGIIFFGDIRMPYREK